VRPHKCRHNIGKVRTGELTHCIELAELCIHIEAIAGFALHRGDPHGEHCVETLSAEKNQVFQGRGAGGEHAALDTASPLVDIHVRNSLGTPEKFFFAPSGKMKWV